MTPELPVRSRSQLFRALLVGLAVASALTAQTRKLTASDGTAHEAFGESVAASGNRILIGANGDDDRGFNSGSAYLFDAVTGTQIRKLTASDGTAQERFGSSVALNSNYALVGSIYDDDMGTQSGSAYVFDATTGTQLRKLTALDGRQGDNFGVSLALSGKTALIGSWQDDDLGTQAGSAYLFDVETGAQLHRLNPTDAAAFDFFGLSVALSGNLALVGSYQQDSLGNNAGAAYLFDVTTGAQLRKFTASDGAAGDRFGTSVAISDDYALIGSPHNDGSKGSAYLFDLRTGQQVHKYAANPASYGYLFGHTVALSGDRVAISRFSELEDHGVRDHAYLFDTAGEQLGKFSASDGHPTDGFALSLALGANHLVVTSYLDDDRGTDSGSAYLFQLPSAAVPERLLGFETAAALGLLLAGRAARFRRGRIGQRRRCSAVGTS
jgi:outer membrane protein assembly factor BamB